MSVYKQLCYVMLCYIRYIYILLCYLLYIHIILLYIRCYTVCTHNRIRSPRLATFGRIKTRWVREVGKFGPYLRYKDWLRRRLLALFMLYILFITLLWFKWGILFLFFIYFWLNCFIYNMGRQCFTIFPLRTGTDSGNPTV